MKPALSVDSRRRALAVAVWALWAMLVAVYPVTAQPQTRADSFQPWHSVMYQSVLAAEVSPDGRQLAFLRSSPRRPLDDDSGPAWVELFVLDADGREVPFVTGEVNVGRPAWLGNDTLVFLTRRDGDQHRALYRISTRGGEAHKIFEHATNVASFDVSSDRRWLAFLAADEESAERDTLEDQGFNQEIFEEELRFTPLAHRRPALSGGPRRPGRASAGPRGIAAVRGVLTRRSALARGGDADAARRR